MSELDMSSQFQPSFDPVARVSAHAAPERRQNLVRILFIHRCLADVERCLHELKRTRYTVSSDIVLAPEQFAERLHSEILRRDHSGVSQLKLARNAGPGQRRDD
jgi:hypothetical protein